MTLWPAQSNTTGEVGLILCPRTRARNLLWGECEAPEEEPNMGAPWGQEYAQQLLEGVPPEDPYDMPLVLYLGFE